MLENRYQYNIKKGERTHIYNFSPDTPLTELYEVLTEMRSDIFNRMKQNEEAEKKQTEQKSESIEEKKDG